MQFTIFFLILFFAYTNQEYCNTPAHCVHTRCDSGRGFSVACRKSASTIFGFGICSCQNAKIAGKPCVKREDCDLTQDCPKSYHSVHCMDEMCTCMVAPKNFLG